MGRMDESLSAASGSHDQDGHHSHIYIYGKTPSKIFSSGISGPISTKLGMLGLIIVCSNDDPRLTLTYLTTMSNLVACALECHLMGKSLQEMTKLTECLYL